MMNSFVLWPCMLLSLAFMLFSCATRGQALEAYSGHERAGVDILWFRFLTDSMQKPTSFLFFSRNRASVDYNNAASAFGSTNAVSYNFKSGIGIVAVGSFLNSGFTPKAGVQLVKQKGAFLFFGWLVAYVAEKGQVDLFGLLRFSPRIRNHWKLFSQVELFPAYNPSSGFWNITERARLGLSYRRWSAGAMADFNQQLVSSQTNTNNNLGIFLRHDF